jgi:hypothetical protein
MNENNYCIETRLIRETFGDDRKIKCVTPEHVRRLDDDVYPGGVVFTTEEGEFIDFEYQLKDFDESELVKYVEFAENLYEKHQKKVSVYIICPKNVRVLVNECPIKSESEFTIKIACSQDDICHMILDDIKNKIRNNVCLDESDLNILADLPVKCNRRERNYFRLEYFKIINRRHY